MGAKELDELAEKNADRVVKEMFELAKTYGIHPDIVYEIYIRGVIAGKDAVLDFLKASKQKQ